MADFRQEVQPTSDPNYLRQSKEPDRIKPLEQVSVPANTISDTRFGTLLQGLGDVTSNALSLFDQTIKRNIVEDAHAKIDPLQDQHGSSLLPSDVQPIAGTGAKGRARLQSAQQYNLFGDGSSSFAPTDANLAYAQMPAEITQPKDLPADAAIEIQRVSRMNEAYRQGTMSDSYYNSQLVATTKELRVRYPGYRDEVDAAVSQITGVQPANALRKSLLSDLNANAAARAGGASDAEKLLQKNATSITEIAPNFFSHRQLYVGKENNILTQAYQLDAERARVTAGTQRLTYDQSTAGQVMTDSAVNVTRAAVAKFNSWVDPTDGKTINQKINELSNTGGTPEQVANITNQLENIKRQVTQGINAEFTDPAKGAGGKTLLAIGKQENAKAATDAALEPINAALKQVKEGNIPMLKTIMDRFDLTKTSEAQRQMENNPTVKFIAGLDKAGGQALIGSALQSTKLLPAFQKSLAEDKLIKTAAGDGSPISKHLDEAAKAGVSGGRVVTALVQGKLGIMNDDKIGSTGNVAAAKSLFDEKFFSGLPEVEQQKTFNLLANNQHTARIVELDKKAPGLLQQYKEWSEYAASVVTSKGISAAQDAASDDRFKLSFNEKTMQLEMEPKPGMTNKLGNGQSNIGTAYVRDLNQTLRTLVPIYKASGADPLQAVKSWVDSQNIKMESNGYEGNPVLQRIGKSIRQMFRGPDATGDEPTGLEPHQTRGVIKGNLSDSPEGAPVRLQGK